MSDQSKPAAVSGKIEIQSSLYEKLTPDLRRRIDKAIADHEPVTYQGLFDKFDLAAHGVSFMAFYRYARRIRTNVALAEFAQLSLPDGAPADQFLPEVVGQRFLAAALDDETPATTLYRLAHAYRIATEASYARRRFAAQIENEKEKTSRRLASESEKEKQKARSNELDELCEMVQQFTKMANQHYEAADQAAPDPSPTQHSELSTQHSSPPAGPDIDPPTKAVLALVQTKLRATAAVKAIEAGEDYPPAAPPRPPHSAPRNERPLAENPFSHPPPRESLPASHPPTFLLSTLNCRLSIVLPPLSTQDPELST